MKAVLFDFGGTLDTNGIHWSEKFWDIYCRFALPIEKNNYENAYCAAERLLPGNLLSPADGFRATLQAQITLQHRFLAGRGKHLDASLASAMAESCFRDVQDTIAHIRPFLESLSSRYALAAVSNFYGNLQASFQELGIDSLFEAFIDSTTAGIAKPDPALFQKALDALHVKGEEAYVIGDSYDRDIVPAKQLGCITIWLRGRSWKNTAEISKADYIVVSLDELPRLLRI
jgi:putative hydrolase of the HAD superfamily